MKQNPSSSSGDLELNSEDLEEILTSVPEALSLCGVSAVSTEVTFTRAPDVYFFSSSAPLRDVLGIIEIMRPRIVFVESEFFELVDLFGEEGPSAEILDDCSPLVRRAESRVGDLCAVLLKWIVDGQLCVWAGTASWVTELQDELNRYMEERRRAEEGAEDAERTNLQRRVDQAVNSVMLNEKFRDTPPHKRKVMGAAFLKGTDFEGEVPGRRQVLARIRSADLEESQRLIADIEGHFAEHATSLLSMDSWSDARTAVVRTEVALEYLKEITGGWRMQASIANRLRDRAVSQGE